MIPFIAEIEGFSSDVGQISETISGLLDRGFRRLYKLGRKSDEVLVLARRIESMSIAGRLWFRETVCARSLVTTNQRV
jgi:hypothetical protein